jgi:hypothetical protein
MQKLYQIQMTVLASIFLAALCFVAANAGELELAEFEAIGNIILHPLYNSLFIPNQSFTMVYQRPPVQFNAREPDSTPCLPHSTSK